MQKQIVQQLGKKMRENIPLRSDLPRSIRMALEKLACADERRATSSAPATCEN